MRTLNPTLAQAVAALPAGYRIKQVRSSTRVIVENEDRIASVTLTNVGITAQGYLKGKQNDTRQYSSWTASLGWMVGPMQTIGRRTVVARLDY